MPVKLVLLIIWNVGSIRNEELNKVVILSASKLWLYTHLVFVIGFIVPFIT